MHRSATIDNRSQSTDIAMTEPMQACKDSAIIEEKTEERGRLQAIHNEQAEASYSQEPVVEDEVQIAPRLVS